MRHPLAAVASSIVLATSLFAAAAFAAPVANWSQQFELTAPGPDTGFAASVAISGKTAVVGAPSEDVDGKQSGGAAFVYHDTGHGWTRVAELTEPAAELRARAGFAPAVALSGLTVVVGAPHHRVGRRRDAGEALVFHRDRSGWNLIAQLRASDVAAGDLFGASVAIEGSRVVVGAPGHDIGSVVSAGAAYVFEPLASGYAQTGRLVASDPSGAGLGVSVAISGDRVLAGAPGFNDAAGLAYVFSRAGDGWVQTARLAPRDGGGQFGQGVAIEGTTALIGAPSRSARQGGSVYVFTDLGHGWHQRQEIFAPVRQFNFYGFSIAMSGSTAMVGAHEEPSGSAGRGGVVHVLTESPSGWANTASFTASDNDPLEGEFGESVSFDGTHALVADGDRRLDTGIGAAYVFGQ
jgi:FG-GAP repeat